MFQNARGAASDDKNRGDFIVWLKSIFLENSNYTMAKSRCRSNILRRGLMPLVFF